MPSQPEKLVYLTDVFWCLAFYCTFCALMLYWKILLCVLLLLFSSIFCLFLAGSWCCGLCPVTSVNSVDEVLLKGYIWWVFCTSGWLVGGWVSLPLVRVIQTCLRVSSSTYFERSYGFCCCYCLCIEVGRKLWRWLRLTKSPRRWTGKIPRIYWYVLWVAFHSIQEKTVILSSWV